MTHVNTPQSRCRLGLARCDVTPPVGIYHRMWGAATHDRATGIHRPLTATALVFQNVHASPSPETEHVLVAVDHCLLWAKEMNTLHKAVCAQTGMIPEQLIVAFSHTHAAGLMGLERMSLPGGDLIPPYLQKLAASIAGIIQEARRSVQPVTIAYAEGRCTLAGQRDFWDEASRQYACGFNPEGSADDTVLTARITDESGKTTASIINYACHPTTLAWDNTLISPDYPGAMREVVERATGAPCIFLQGASGDLGPREGFVGDTAVADRNGRQLAYSALAALEALPPPATRFVYMGPVVSGATLGAWQHVPLTAQELQRKSRWHCRRWTVDLPYRGELRSLEEIEAERARWQRDEEAAHQSGDEAKARDCRAMVERMTRWLVRISVLPPGKMFPLPVTLLRIGDAFWVTVEGEHYQFLQRFLRQRFPGAPIIVATLANGSRPSYLPTRDVYGKGIYQESIAVLAPGSLEQLAEMIGKQIQEWSDIM